MASGKKNYFRHSFGARNDEFIVELMEEFGVQGYFYFFSLIEVCAEKTEGSLDYNVTIHASTLRKELRLTTRRLNQFLTFLQERSKVRYTLVKHSYEIIIHNLPKYLGRYKNEIQKNAPNKRKEKENKLNEIKLNKRKPENPKKEILVGAIAPLSECEIASEMLADVSHELQNSWLKSYELEYLREQILEANRWIMINPRKEPKRKDRFLTSWFARGHDAWRKKIPSNPVSRNQQNQDYILSQENPYEVNHG